MINTLLHDKSMTKYRLSKLSGIPYTTINDICSGKADIKKCSVDNVYRIAKALDVTVEELLEPYYIDRPDFELFKSNTCHRLKEKGDMLKKKKDLESGHLSVADSKKRNNN